MSDVVMYDSLDPAVSFMRVIQSNNFLLLYHRCGENTMSFILLRNFLVFMKNSSWCSYYRAHVQREKVWFFVAVLRSQEHVCFDRTFDVTASIFEFFVPHEQEKLFLRILASFEQEGIVSGLTKLENRVQVTGAL